MLDRWVVRIALLQQAEPESHDRPALDLTFYIGRVHGESDVLGDDVLVHGDLAGAGIDRQVDRVAVEARRVKRRIHVALDALGVVRRRRRDERPVRDQSTAGRLRQPRELRERGALFFNRSDHRAVA